MSGTSLLKKHPDNDFFCFILADFDKTAILRVSVSPDIFSLNETKYWRDDGTQLFRLSLEE